MSYAKCIVCGKEFKDTHSGRMGNKYCCREHFNKYKKENGTWNKGKTWEEMYDLETLGKLKEHVTSFGKNHFNYNRERYDNILRNLLKNPRHSKDKKLEIRKLVLEVGVDEAIKTLAKKAMPSKKTYRKLCFNKWGDNCLNCGLSNDLVQIDVHHIDCNRRNNTVENLIPLCSKCHWKLRKNPGKCIELLGKT